MSLFIFHRFRLLVQPRFVVFHFFSMSSLFTLWWWYSHATRQVSMYRHTKTIHGRMPSFSPVRAFLSSVDHIYIMYKFWVSNFFFLSFSRLILDSKLIFDKLCFRSTFISSMPPYSLPPLYNPMLSCIYLLVFIALARRSSIPMRIYIYIYVTCI